MWWGSLHVCSSSEQAKTSHYFEYTMHLEDSCMTAGLVIKLLLKRSAEVKIHRCHVNIPPTHFLLHLPCKSMTPCDVQHAWSRGISLSVIEVNPLKKSDWRAHCIHFFKLILKDSELDPVDRGAPTLPNFRCLDLTLCKTVLASLFSIFLSPDSRGSPHAINPIFR